MEKYEVLISEKDKNNESYLKDSVDRAIGDLVKKDENMDCAYNYYNCKRDAKQFKYLEDKLGIQIATELAMIPLIRRHIDVLVGEILTNKFQPLITCRDSETMEKMTEEKNKAKSKNELEVFKKSFMSKVRALSGNSKIITDEEAEVMTNAANESFVSEFEKAANYIMQYILDSRDIDIKSKRAELLKSLLITGRAYYSVIKSNSSELPELKVWDPRQVFYERTQDKYIKNSPRAVIVRKMSYIEVMTEYGDQLTIEQKESLRDCNNESRPYIGLNEFNQPDIISEYDSELDNSLTVYYVEWLSTNKNGKEYRVDRYKGVRIGSDIYVDMDKDDSAERSKLCPSRCTLSLNGMEYAKEKGKPYSLVLAMADTQDRYDLVHYYMQYAVESSGTKGSYVMMNLIPAWLDEDEKVRLMKWNQMKKQGTAPLETNPESDESKLNTIFNGYNETVDYNTIQALQATIQQLENTACKISGVSPEKLFEIEQRDAVKNVQVGIKQSTVITKPIMHIIDCLSVDMLTALVNGFKESYREGFIGYQTLNSKKLDIIKLMPEHYVYTDYGVMIVNDDDSKLELESVKSMIEPLIQSGQTDLTLLVDMATTQSVTDLKQKIKENNSATVQAKQQLQQMQEQLQQQEQQLKSSQEEMKKLQVENERLKNLQLELKEKEINGRLRIDDKRIDTDKKIKEENIKLNKAKVDLQRLEMMDNNPYNNEIKD